MMKKIFALIICFTLTISPMRLFAASEDDTSYISVSYNPADQKLVVDGRDNIASGSPVVVHLVFGSNAQPSQDNPPIVFDMVFASDEGRFHSESVLPSDTANGVYTVCVGNEARENAYTKDITLYNPYGNATKDALALVNSSPSATALENILTNYGADLGIDMKKEESPEFFAKVIYGVKKSEGNFTIGEFADAVSYARGAVILSNGGSVVDVMRNYASAFDYTNELYEKLDEKVRTKADKIFVRKDFDNGYVSYNDAVLTAKAVLVESYGELKTLITSQSEQYGVNLDGKYSSLSNNDKSNVFKMMYKEKDDFNTVDDIAESFDKAVKDLSAPAGGSGGSGGGGGGGSASSDSRGHVGSTTVVGTDLPETKQESVVFSDIDSSFAKENIIRLASLGIINGYENGTFCPANTVTRAEFCKMVCVAFGFGGDDTQSFSDVSQNDWFYRYTGVLFNLGIINGDGNNFRPAEPITRQDVAVILCRALDVLGKNTNGTYEFADSDSVADYAKQSVSTLAANGYFKGDGTNFRPYSDITRAETAAVIDRIYTSIR